MRGRSCTYVDKAEVENHMRVSYRILALIVVRFNQDEFTGIRPGGVIYHERAGLVQDIRWGSI